MSRFANVTVEDDTVILFSRECQLHDRDVLYQKWFWGGIMAESLIFVSDDVVTHSDEELEQEVCASPMVRSDTSMTVKRDDRGFVFVNFNFIVDGDEDDHYLPEVLTSEALQEKREKTRAAIGANNQRAIEQIRSNKLRYDRV